MDQRLGEALDETSPLGAPAHEFGHYIAARIHLVPASCQSILYWTSPGEGDDDAIAFVTAADERADRYDGRGDEGA